MMCIYLHVFVYKNIDRLYGPIPKRIECIGVDIDDILSSHVST